MKKSVLIFGATGMVGEEIMKLCVDSHVVSSITIVVRKKVNVKSKKIKQIIIPDFSNISVFKNNLINHDLCFYCVGVYQQQVSRSKFIKITQDYFKKIIGIIASKKMTMCLFSAQGANSHSSLLFAKYKGVAEELAREAGFKQVYIFRPSYISPGNIRSNGPWYERVIEPIYPVFDFLFPLFCVKSCVLAQKMVSVGLSQPQQTVYENTEIRRKP